jgi:cytoskeletal protein CcmA (bactofilin family)
MISKSFVMRCLSSGGAVHYRRSRSSMPQPNQPSSVPQQCSASNKGEVAPPRQAPRARFESYLNQGSKISGKLHFEGPTEIYGQIDGEIVAKNSILIGESAVVTAPITATSIIVEGDVKGDIIGSQRIELRPSAKVLGKLSAPNLEVHNGAMLEGHCAMQSEGLCGDRKVTVFPTDEHTAAHSFGFIWISSSNEIRRNFGESSASSVMQFPKATLPMKSVEEPARRHVLQRQDGGH